MHSLAGDLENGLITFKTHINLNYVHSVRTAQKTHSVSVTKTSQLMLYRNIIAACSQIHTKHINTLCGQKVELLNVKLAVHTVNLKL